MNDNTDSVILDDNQMKQDDGGLEGPILMMIKRNHGTKEIDRFPGYENLRLRKDDGTKLNEFNHRIRVFLLAISILGLSYHGGLYGCMEYSILGSGQKVNGKLPLRKTVVTLSLGYSTCYSIITSLTAFLLLCSLMPKKRHWSLPAIFLCIAELVSEIGDAVWAIWLSFTHLPLFIALFYSTGAAFVIIGKFWCWLGAVRLYEIRLDE